MQTVFTLKQYSWVEAWEFFVIDSFAFFVMIKSLHQSFTQYVSLFAKKLDHNCMVKEDKPVANSLRGFFHTVLVIFGK